MTTQQQRPDSESNVNPQQPPAGYYPPQGAYPYPPQPAPTSTNGLATAGFVVALIGAVLSLIPIVGTVSWLISPVGGVIAVVGLVLAGSRHTGRGLAIAGVLLAVFGLIMCTVYTVSFANAVSSTPSYSAPSYSAPSYSASSAAPAAAAPGTYGAGTYEVGTEIQPGTYKTTGSSHCYWERDKDANGELSSIIANDNVQGSGVMKVSSSDRYIKFDGTCTWVKQ